MNDADLDLAVRAIVASRMINTGQVCNCAERLYVQEGVYDDVVERLSAAFKNVTWGDPATQKGLDMGPLITASALQRVEQKVADAVAAGATIVTGGRRAGTTGFFFEPTLLTNVTQQMDIMQHETFGPVLPVMKFSTLDEAIALANDSDYGLTSSIFTCNLNTAMLALKRLKFGKPTSTANISRRCRGSMRAGVSPALAALTAGTGWKSICRLTSPICSISKHLSHGVRLSSPVRQTSALSALRISLSELLVKPLPGILLCFPIALISREIT